MSVTLNNIIIDHNKKTLLDFFRTKKTNKLIKKIRAFDCKKVLTSKNLFQFSSPHMQQVFNMFFILFFISSKMFTMLPNQNNFIVVKFHFHNFFILIWLKCTETAAWRKTNSVQYDSNIKQFFLNLKSWLNKDAIQIQCTVLTGASISRKQRAVLNCYVLFFQLVFVLRKCKRGVSYIRSFFLEAHSLPPVN